MSDINAALEQLVVRNLIACPTCQGSFTLQPRAVKGKSSSLKCRDCSSDYPIVNAVPLLLPLDTYSFLGAELSAQVNFDFDIEDMLVAFGSANAFVPKDISLVGEFGNINGRFRLGEHVAAKATQGLQPDCSSGLSLVRHFCPPEIYAGGTAFRSVRLKNMLPHTLETTGDNPYHISYHLFDGVGAEVEFEGRRSRIPIRLPPLKELSIPVRFMVPDTPGKYTFTFHLVHEGVRWYPEFLRLPMVVLPKPSVESVPVKGVLGEFNYQKDVEFSRSVIESALDEFDQDEVVAVELASGFHPQILLHEFPKLRPLCIDLCLPELQLSNAYYRSMRPKAEFVMLCADCMSMPLRDGSVDLFVICAALHHFPDPIALLKAVARKLRVGGRLVILREPCDVNPEDANFIAELERGYNEQQFTVEEFCYMFSTAGFEVVDSRVDFGGSFKAILTKRA